MYYDQKGNEITLEEWAIALKDNSIKKNTVGKYVVSTIYLGLDHNFGEGKPLIFETMVFEEGEEEVDVERYETVEQAKEGHERFVKKYKKK